jgi:hypothetical protein
MNATTTDIPDIDDTYHRPGAARLAADLGATLAAHDRSTLHIPSLQRMACTCGGTVVDAAGRQRCLRCGRDHGAAIEPDDAGDLLGTRERPARFDGGEL